MMLHSQEDGRFWNSFAKAGAGQRFCLILGTCFFCGLLPGAPGTYGSALAVLLAFLIWALPILYRALLVAGILVLAIAVCSVSASVLGKGDPSEIVIDEVAGYMVAVFALPKSFLALGLAFIFFRIFDILKPFPIRQADRNVRGGLGIVLDDMLAGVMTYIVVKLIFLKLFGLMYVR